MSENQKSVHTGTEKTKRLALSGILLALATILSFIRVFEAPFGGSITACSMLPVVMLAYIYGVKWGIGVGVVYGVLQAIVGATMTSAFAGQNAGSAVAICFFDYIAAFGVLSLAGVFKGKIKNHTAAFTVGTVLAVFVRYLCHVVSGYIFYGNWADWFFGEKFVNAFSKKLIETCSPKMLSLVYSMIYNGAYMLPELIITAVGAALVISLIPPVRREMVKSK